MFSQLCRGVTFKEHGYYLCRLISLRRLLKIILRNLGEMPRNRQRQEDNDEQTERDTAENEQCIVRKYLLLPGLFMVLAGIGASAFLLSDVIDLSFINGYVHLGKDLWVLHLILWVLALIGLGLVYCAFPNAHAAIKTACCYGCDLWVSWQEKRLLNEDDEEDVEE